MLEFDDYTIQETSAFEKLQVIQNEETTVETEATTEEYIPAFQKQFEDYTTTEFLLFLISLLLLTSLFIMCFRKGKI